MEDAAMMFREMRYVYEVYRQRSFSKAAQALFIAQPSLSQMIKKAETRAGGPLFDRSTVPVHLTELGRAYIEAAEEIMQAQERFSRYASDAEHCLRGSLSLGGTTLFTSYVLPPLISAFSARYPGVEIRLHEQHTRVLRRELQEGTLDLAVDNSVLDPLHYHQLVYRQERLILAVPAVFAINESCRAHQLTAQEVIDGNARHVPPLALERLRDTPFLLLKEGNDTRTRAERLCSRAGFTPRVRLQLDQQLAAYNLAAYGLGATFLSDTLVKCAVPDHRLVYYPLEGEDAQRSISFFHKRSRFLSAPMEAFLRMLQENPQNI